jgi:hypothetical protein
VIYEHDANDRAVAPQKVEVLGLRQQCESTVFTNWGVFFAKTYTFFLETLFDPVGFRKFKFLPHNNL